MYKCLSHLLSRYWLNKENLTVNIYGSVAIGLGRRVSLVWWRRADMEEDKKAAVSSYFYLQPQVMSHLPSFPCQNQHFYMVMQSNLFTLFLSALSSRWQEICLYPVEARISIDILTYTYTGYCHWMAAP